MNRDIVRLDAAIRVSKSALARLRDSIDYDAETLAAGIGAGDTASREQQRALDAFVQRYQQVFEHIAQRFFASVYRAAELGDRPPPLRTLLVWAEEVGLVASARVWSERAELRNRLVHEYPVEPEQRAIALTSAVAESRLILEEFDAALGYVDERRLLEA